MNGWDIFTYLMSATLAVSAIAIFAFFLRDARTIMQGGRSEKEPDEDQD